MTMKKQIFLLITIGFAIVLNQMLSFKPENVKLSVETPSLKPLKKENVNKSGKERTNLKLRKLYSKSIPLFSPLDKEALLPMPAEKLGVALKNQAKLIRYAKNETHYSDDDLTITKAKLKTTVALLQKWNNADLNSLSELFDTYLLKGRDRKGNVKFTGYYSPIIEVNSEYGGEYIYPIYEKPNEDDWKNGLPTRYEILHKDALADQGLELAWAKSQKDISSLQLQGSGYMKYPDGTTEYIGYGGNNGRTKKVVYKAKKVNMSPSAENRKEAKGDSIEMDSIQEVAYRRPGYTFFQRNNKPFPIGAGGVEVTPDISVAVDPKLVPLGACLLVEFPVINKKGKLLHHEYKILLAQDTGGAIKGPGRVDFYTGIGVKALHKARYLSHYGKVWILMPKEK